MSELAEKITNRIGKADCETPKRCLDRYGRYCAVCVPSAAEVDLARQVLDHEATIAERDATIAELRRHIENTETFWNAHVCQEDYR